MVALRLRIKLERPAPDRFEERVAPNGKFTFGRRARHLRAANMGELLLGFIGMQLVQSRGVAALFVAFVLAVALLAGLVPAAKAQELPVPCFAFAQDMFGDWIAIEPVTLDLPDGTIDISPGHTVSVPVAGFLDARCS